MSYADMVKHDMDRFGCDSVEVTPNGVWIEQRHTRSGKRLRRPRLAFVTVSVLRGLVEEVEALEAT